MSARILGHIEFDFWPDDHPPVRFLNCERKRDFTVSSGTEEPESFQCASKRFSTNPLSAGDKAGSSKSSTRRMSSCR
jgi:hypothetical protein